MSEQQMNGDIREEILRLKKEKNALILAHYYENLEVQQIADGFGDSFELAKKAKRVVTLVDGNIVHDTKFDTERE